MVKNSIKIVDVVEPIQTQVEEVEFEKDSSIEEEEPVKPEPVKPIKERKKKAIPDVVVPPPSPIRTPDEKVVCSFCNKTMSAKSLKYSHDKSCKGKAKPPSEQQFEVKQEPKPTPESIVVDFGDPYTRIYDAKQKRAEKLQLLVAHSLNKNKKM